MFEAYQELFCVFGESFMNVTGFVKVVFLLISVSLPLDIGHYNFHEKYENKLIRD